MSSICSSIVYLCLTLWHCFVVGFYVDYSGMSKILGEVNILLFELHFPTIATNTHKKKNRVNVKDSVGMGLYGMCKAAEKKKFFKDYNHIPTFFAFIFCWFWENFVFVLSGFCIIFISFFGDKFLSDVAL